jgi:predicted AAA+ superfamily ATPase
MHELPAWKKSLKRKPIVSSKYYFFDTGVVSTLQGRSFKTGTPEFGEAFETYIFHELLCHRDYVSGDSLSYWRSTSGFEVDFIVGDHTAIETKAKKNVTADDLRGLRALSEEQKLGQMICVSLEPRVRLVDGIRILPWHVFLDELWGGT